MPSTYYATYNAHGAGPDGRYGIPGTSYQANAYAPVENSGVRQVDACIWKTSGVMLLYIAAFSVAAAVAKKDATTSYSDSYLQNLAITGSLATIASIFCCCCCCNSRSGQS